jgi:hypothetical protein
MGSRGLPTDHARKTLRTVSRFAGMHIGQHVGAEALEAARGEAPQEWNTMKLSAIRALGSGHHRGLLYVCRALKPVIGVAIFWQLG